MLKRLLAVLAISAAIAACTPTDGGTSPNVAVPTPSMGMPTEMPSEMPSMPTETLGTESPSPSPSP